MTNRFNIHRAIGISLGLHVVLIWGLSHAKIHHALFNVKDNVVSQNAPYIVWSGQEKKVLEKSPVKIQTLKSSQNIIKIPDATQAIYEKNVVKNYIDLSETKHPLTTEKEFSSPSVLQKGADLLAAPKAHKNRGFAYPKRAIRAGYEGMVILKVRVNSDGACGEVQIEKSSGYNILDHEAVKTVSKWVFDPARKNNRAIDSWINIPIEFKIRDDKT
ncbi:energy transducer TonB, partial [PVC group bacterium]|nr:energy transducer TonB [PVC group bacterium]